MESHAGGAASVAAEVRAEMGRQNQTRTSLAAALGVTAHTAGRKFSGEVEFTLTELMQVAAWLDVQIENLWPPAQANDAAAS